MTPGVSFGELAILYENKRSATIFALEEVKCYTLESKIFKEVVMGDDTDLPSPGVETDRMDQEIKEAQAKAEKSYEIKM
jgi:CRP-like cAMP-binding protein